MNKDEEMLAFLQKVEGEKDGSLVTGFLVIAETINPDRPDSTGYSYYANGSPALKLGMADQLSWVVRDDLQMTREDEDE